MKTETSGISDWPGSSMKLDSGSTIQVCSYISGEAQGERYWYEGAWQNPLEHEGFLVVRGFHAAEFPVGTVIKFNITITKPEIVP